MKTLTERQMEKLMNTIAQAMNEKELPDTITEENYFDAAEAIVEPEIDDQELEEYYNELQDNYPEQWRQLIISINEDWKKIVDAVIEFGY